MNELLVQILSYARGVWRYRWIALGAAIAVAIAGNVAVYRMPDQYRASARVHVDTRSMLRPLLKGLTVNTDVHERVKFITSSLFSRPNLEKIARMSDLDIEAATPEEMDQLIRHLEERLHLRQFGGADLYKISYTGTDPAAAKSVVQSAITLFVESALGESRSDTNQAQRFLERQITEYKQKLEGAEDRLTEFRRKHAGMLPGSQGDYYKRLQDAIDRLEQTKLKLRVVREKRDELQRQLAGREPVYGIMQSRNPQGSVSSEQAALEARIANLEKKLDESLIRFTENHPDVQATKDALERLRERKDAEREASAQGSLDGGEYPQRQQYSPVYREMQGTLAQTEAEVAEQRALVQEYEKEVANLREKVDTLPKIDTELERLKRERNEAEHRYEAFLKRQQSAELTEKADRSSDEVKFKVVDPPHVAPEPVAPNRPLLLSVALLASLGGGGMLGVVLSQLRPTFESRYRLSAVTGLPVLGSVSLVRTPRIRYRKRAEFGLYILAAAGFLAAYIVGAVLNMKGVGLLATLVRLWG